MGQAERRAEGRTRHYTREEAQRLGWNVEGPAAGGKFLDEQELLDSFPRLRAHLRDGLPDFALLSGDGKLRGVIGCKGCAHELKNALAEARACAEAINQVDGFDVRLAFGVAGAPGKFVQARGQYRVNGRWIDLTSRAWPLTQLPAPFELETALRRDDGTTEVQLPDKREFFDAAIRISHILRLAKIEEAQRPRTIAATILALYQGDFSLAPEAVLGNIAANIAAALEGPQFRDVPPRHRELLARTLALSPESRHLKEAVPEIVHQLERLNVRSIMRSEVDFLGEFYETFLRYGMDARKLGVVFTPRHITRFCAELAGVRPGMAVYDAACGTGGFLVAAFDRMVQDAAPPAREALGASLWGNETNPTVWALAVLNMFFRGDGKSRISPESCFDDPGTKTGRFDRALLNPPFSQEGEPEWMFIDHALESLCPGGELAVVVKTNVMVDPELARWRRELVARHQVLAVISLPAELFYPTNAPTIILVVKAHAPDPRRETFLATIQDDGYKISKQRRVEAGHSQLPAALELYREYLRRGAIQPVPGFALAIAHEAIADGEEICAERWLPSAPFTPEGFEQRYQEAMRQISLAIANYPDAIDELVAGYEDLLGQGAAGGRPAKRAGLEEWFSIHAGGSTGVQNYPGGSVPYISSGDSYNGIVGLVSAPEDEVFETPCVTVSAFGQAYLQPWRFCARGNGGSAVRVLRPRYRMTLAELVWMVGQINAQRWRFNYGRMATRSRLRGLKLDPPPPVLPGITGLEARLRNFRRGLTALMGV